MVQYFTPTVSKPSTSVGETKIFNIRDLNFKLKINVKKTGIFYDNDGASKVPTYTTSSKSRGKVLMINNIFEGEKEYRAGSEVDEFNLNELFRQIGFVVEKHRNKKKKVRYGKDFALPP